MKRTPVHAAFSRTAAEFSSTAFLCAQHYKENAAEITPDMSPETRMLRMDEIVRQQDALRHRFD